MFRSMSRTAVAAVVALTFVLASVPAQASPFGFSGPSADTHAGWFDAALSWVSNLLFGEETSSPASGGSAFEAATTSTGLIGDFATPLSGSCIDPGGNPRCNL